ncbi:MAG: hypothetical protein ABUT20_10615, partial [Bacteroidota bacterium]
MIRFICAIFLIVFFGTRSLAQNIDSTITAYGTRFGQERTYIHYDKSTYVPGETIWFKAYLMQGIFPADESKTFYIDWTDDKGNLLAHNLSPVVEATTNGQFDIPADYAGQYIHVKAYTKWMLNFDTDFIYNKDLRILNKNAGASAVKNTSIPVIEFFPEGGDAIEGLINKIAFKANDQWGRPVKIKGIVQNNSGAKIDSLHVLHDGMGYFFINPKLGESFTARWRDEKGTEHTTPLPPIKSSGVSIQVTISGAKRNFTINASADISAGLGSVYLIGTMNQMPVFKVEKDIRSGVSSGIIPTQSLPSGILTITVFDKQWKPLAERITFVNNDDYHFYPELSVEHWGLNKRARNEIQITVPEEISSNLSVAVTDADIDADSSSTIISHLLLTSEVKGTVYNPSYYFSDKSDSINQHLDLVMLTHGWRRFVWEDVVKGKLPRIIYQKDTSYLTLSGKVYGAQPSQFREGATIILILKQKDAEGKLLYLPIEPNGVFSDPSVSLFDTAHIYYRLSKGLTDASVLFMENRLPPPARRMSANGIFYNQLSDTTGNSRHFNFADEMTKLLQLYEGKLLENVIVKSKTKTPVQILDEKYASGLFTGGDGYQFDLVNDRLAGSSQNIFYYLQGKVAGLQIVPGGSTPSLTWRGGSPQLFVDEVATDAEMVNSISVNDIAYVKVFRPPFFGGGTSGNGAIAIYTRRGNDIQTTPGKGLNNNSVSGYTAIRQFYSPNYSNYSKENEKKDLRTTLYWNPQVTTNAQKKQVRLSFYNNDISRAF